MKIDNTALVLHQTCPAQYDLRMRQHWAPRQKSAALGFGGAFHAGLEAWYRYHSLPRALVAISESWEPGPADDYRTLEKCLRSMESYSHNYPAENFTFVQGPEGPLVEVVFTLPLTLQDGTQLTCDDGDIIEYGGIFDGLVDSGGPAAHVYVLEHKTTSRLGAYYFNQFKPNNQISGYVWAAGVLSGKRVGGALVNAICVTKTKQTPEFARNITTRSEEELDRWALDVQTTCNEIKYHERTGRWPQRTKSCTQYGQCEFYNVHVRSDVPTQLRILEQDYVKREWSHETRDEASASAD